MGNGFDGMTLLYAVGSGIAIWVQYRRAVSRGVDHAED